VDRVKPRNGRHVSTDHVPRLRAHHRLDGDQPMTSSVAFLISDLTDRGGRGASMNGFGLYPDNNLKPSGFSNYSNRSEISTGELVFVKHLCVKK
jgi:hypothetical protein